MDDMLNRLLMTLFIIPELELKNCKYLFCKVRRNKILIMALLCHTSSDHMGLLITIGLQSISPGLCQIVYRKESYAM